MTPRTLDGLCRIGTLFFVVVGLSTLARSAVVFVPLPEEFLWLHVIENDEPTISPRLDFDGDGIGDLLIASDFSGVSLFTGRNVRLVTVGGVTSNAPEGTTLNQLSLIQGVGTWLYGNRADHINPPEFNLLPLKRSIALAGLGSPPFTKFEQGGGYIGVESTGPDGIHYGWLRIENDNPQWLTGGRVTGYAYESVPGVPIMVGTIPEPSSLWLTAVGIGLGLCRRRESKGNANERVEHKSCWSR